MSLTDRSRELLSFNFLSFSSRIFFDKVIMVKPQVQLKFLNVKIFQQEMILHFVFYVDILVFQCSHLFLVCLYFQNKPAIKFYLSPLNLFFIFYNSRGVSDFPLGLVFVDQDA